MGLQKSGTTDKFTFYYQNKDHLGTVRETVTSTGAMKQRVNYYPFGGQLVDTLTVMMWNRDFQQYKYNGKEFDGTFGLNTYDYGARQHDPILARWDRLDPLCEKEPGVSPYAYCENNPVKFIDPDGKEVRDGTGAYCKENAGLKALTRTLAAHNDKNSIMIVAHGVYNSEKDRYASSIDIQTYNPNSGEWSHNNISNGEQLDNFLSANSQTWNDYKDGKISADDLNIVFYSCGSSPLVEEISGDDAFKDVNLIAPSKKVHHQIYENGDQKTTVENTKFVEKDGKLVPVGKQDYGKWVSFKNGSVQTTYSGDKNLLPGTNGFKY